MNLLTCGYWQLATGVHKINVHIQTLPNTHTITKKRLIHVQQQYWLFMECKCSWTMYTHFSLSIIIYLLGGQGKRARIVSLCFFLSLFVLWAHSLTPFSSFYSLGAPLWGRYKALFCLSSISWKARNNERARKKMYNSLKRMRYNWKRRFE